MIEDWVSSLCEYDKDANRKWLSHTEFDIRRTIGDLSVYSEKEYSNNNRVFQHPEASLANVTFEPGSSNNIFIWGARMASRQPVIVSGNDHRIIVGPCKKFTARIGVSGENNLFFSGLYSTCNQANIVLQGERKSILLGQDCMLSFDVVLRAADSHGIIDLETMSVVNSPGSILIGTHVWLGEGVSVLKGVHIGRGSIIASRALVSCDIPETSLAVGVPARVLRGGQTWTRAPQPNPIEIKNLCRIFGDNVKI